MFHIFTDRSNERSSYHYEISVTHTLDFDECFTLSPIEVMSESLGRTLDSDECFTLSPMEVMSDRAT